jgi:hypothetical protein
MSREALRVLGDAVSRNSSVFNSWDTFADGAPYSSFSWPAAAGMGVGCPDMVECALLAQTWSWASAWLE